MENFANDENLTNTEKEYNELWNLIIENNIATDDELRLVSYINGWRLETLEDVLYVRTGYRDVKQFKECELNEIEYTSEDLVIRYSYLIGRFIEYILKIHDLNIQNSTNESIKQVYCINAVNALKKWERLRGLRDATPNRKIGECDLAEVYHTKDDYVFTAFKKQDEYINLLIDKRGAIQVQNIPSIINMLEKQITDNKHR